MHQFRLDLAYKTIPESSAPRNRLTLLAADGGGWDHEPPRLKRHVGPTKRNTRRVLTELGR